MRRFVTSVVLCILLTILGTIVWTRGAGLRLGAAAAALSGPYATEEAWVVNEIVRDITEMSAFPKHAALPAVMSARSDGVYQATIADQTVDIRLAADVWSPDAFRPVATAGLKNRSSRNPASSAMTAVHPRLLELTTASLIAAADDASRALSTDMTDARAHEAAALAIGAFALRESAGRFSDPRWALNRMTAHLALAASLTDTPGTDGRLAQAVLLTLGNRQVRALEEIDHLRQADGSKAAAAWARALRLRITQDWRITRAPDLDSPLEQLEYFRARRATVNGSLASTELSLLRAKPEAEWFRIVEASMQGVEDGWIAVEALPLERAEYQEVYRQMHGRPIGDQPWEALNAPAGRSVAGKTIQVLPWGAWAEFAQRHIEMFVDRNDRFYRHWQGNEERADAEKVRLGRELGSLSMFPIATVFWTKGPKGSEADLTRINEAIAFALRSPERIPPQVWSFVELAGHYEPLRQTLPAPSAWFMPPSPRVAQNASGRLALAGVPKGESTIAPMLAVAPYDSALAGLYLTTKFGKNKPLDAIRTAYGERLQYDTRAIDAALAVAKDDERLALMKRACDITARACINLAREHAWADREAEAVAMYERAFRDDSVDAVLMSQSSDWLVRYYERSGRIKEALALAERSAKVGSARGLLTAARLYERLGRFEDAEAMFRAEADHYDRTEQLLGFYYRCLFVRRHPQFESPWKAIVAKVFPNGLVATPTASQRPAKGVVLMADTPFVRKAGLLSGDIIVGLDGWQVENLDQYRAVNAFVERPEMRLTVWRGSTVHDVEITASDRSLGVDLRSYPIEGWGEK